MIGLVAEPKASRRRGEESALRLEGGLFGPEFLALLEKGAVPFQTPRDFGLPRGRSLQEEIAEAYREAKTLYTLFRARLERALGTEAEGEVTRERWVRPFLSLLGYRLDYRGHAEAGGRKYEILYRADEGEEAPPVHVVPWGQDLSRATRRGRSPHGLLQDYLNASEHLWGLVTNGRVLRLLRKTPFVRRQAYLEVDLEALMEEDRFGEFALVYRLLHRSRLPRDAATAHEAPVERYHLMAVEQGERVREGLREAVEGFLQELGTGFLRGPMGKELARDPEALYHDLLRLAYRVLFLLVAEARGVLGGNEVYREAFGLHRLLRLSERREAYTEDPDLWLGLKTLFELLRNPGLQVNGAPAAEALGLSVLNSGLFGERLRLEEAPFSVENRHLLAAFRRLALFYDPEARALKRVNYAALDVEELGSVYESLLDHSPQVVWEEGGWAFRFARGSERKRTGSYYTPEALVDLVLKEALDPVVEARLKAAGDDPKAQEAALLSLKVLDPAAGSGHFLLGAARRLGRRLAQIRTGEEEPSPEAYREAVRDVVRSCLYAVDKNPMAVELCKVALWMESHVPGKPLSFLDNRVRCGDSLVGVLDPKLLAEGVPKEAYEPKTGDDKEVAKAVRKANEMALRGMADLFSQDLLTAEEENYAKVLEEFARLPEDTPEQVAAKAKLYETLREKGTLKRLLLASDLWTTAFFQPLRGTGPFITSDHVRTVLQGGRVAKELEELARDLSACHRFFHWWLEFPDVFQKGGFDVVLGNPPWEKLKLQDKEFFADKAPEIAQAENAAKRKRLIQALKEKNPELFRAYQEALAEAEAVSGFVRHSGRFPLTARGDVNTYPLFAELARALRAPQGRAGLVLPTGIATDDSNKEFFAQVVERGELYALYDFQNREKLFSAVSSLQKFCVFVLGNEGKTTARMAFFLTRPEDLEDAARVFSLAPEDFALLNPNTKTCPVFRTRQDAELTRAVYRRVPVLWREGLEENPWGVRFLALFHMSNDSHLFRTREELLNGGFRLVGNRFVRGEEVYLPLYEAKMFWHHDHRFATFAGEDTRDVEPREKRDPAFLPLPRYWVPRREVEERFRKAGWERGWAVAFRDIARATDERTAVFAPLPRVGVGNTAPLMLTSQKSPFEIAFVANWSSLVLDFIARVKVAGTHLNFHYVKQFPVLPPSAYRPEDLRFIVPRVLELAYTAWDLAPLAQDVWEEADEPLREAIRAWQEAAPTHPDSPPDWAEGPYPFPPFVWDEERRAQIRAELDAYYARLYGLSRKQLRYILDPQDLTEGELADLLSPHEEVEDPLDEEAYQKRVTQSRFPGETFRVLKEKELRRYGEYRTRRLVLEAWERLSRDKMLPEPFAGGVL
ncbi:MAG: Eco57I restriction-modification methylase domain-containing protein [Thermus sp.]|uniref:Eco57I restriction-modification methylase domain-containing protein n=1 Tax=Thermus sp. TaxID=275 RepID=UPI00391D41FE